MRMKWAGGVALFGAAAAVLGTGPAGAAAKTPADLLDLTNWKLTIPTAGEDSDVAAEIKQPRLDSYTSSYFKLNKAGDGVVFKAHAGGATTKGSDYPRSELREMAGGDKAAWSTTKGKHTLSLRVAITHLPEAKPDVVVAQIHDAKDDIVTIRLDGPDHLYVDHGSENYGTLDDNYRLGTAFNASIVAEGGRVKVYYNGTKKVDKSVRTTDNYFKAGIYTQSNESKGDTSSAYGESVISQLKVSHQ